MSNSFPSLRAWMISVITTLVVLGCGASSTADVHTIQSTPEPVSTMDYSTVGLTLAPSPRPIQEPASSPVLGEISVVVTAANGNIFIRRGPDLAFNPISVLKKGQTAIATARDVLGNWLRIASPDDPTREGWISIMSKYTKVDGNIDALVELEPAVWPQLAYVRNCTHNQMVLDPGGLLIPPVDSFPDNDIRVNPGSYVVIDVDVDEYPQILSVEISEGSSIDIIFDGYGEKKKCPAR